PALDTRDARPKIGAGASCGPRQREQAMVRVLGIDHLTIRVSDFKKSRAFYDKLLGFMGFELEWEFDKTAGWNNGRTMYWISQADARGRKHKHRIGDVGFHHYAFELRRPKDVDDLYEFLK